MLEPPDDESGGIAEDGVPALPLVPDEVPLLLLPPDSEGMPVDPPDDVPLLPLEPPLVPEPEPPPVMPAQALSSAAQAMGNIHLVIEHSRSIQKGSAPVVRTGGLHVECRE